MDRIDWVFAFAIAVFACIAIAYQDWTVLFIPLCFVVVYSIIKVAGREE